MIASVFLVANTMHLVVYARRPELETMKLVGATFGFVVTPFLIEGAILGLMGGIVATVGLLAIHTLLFARVGDYLNLAMSNESLVFLPVTWLVLLVLVGVLLGMAGCYKAVNKFWKAAS
jgi:cell division transport system permease protein